MDLGGPVLSYRAVHSVDRVNMPRATDCRSLRYSEGQARHRVVQPQSSTSANVQLLWYRLAHIDLYTILQPRRTDEKLSIGRSSTG